MTKIEMQEKLKSLGIKKRFKPYWGEGDDKTLYLQTRKPAKIVDGRLQGSEIVLYDDKQFLVWTPQRLKAKRIAKERNLKINNLDGEAEIYIPVELADELLPKFGAKIKRQITEKELKKFVERGKKLAEIRKNTPKVVGGLENVANF